jgi:competence protein CoiA
VPLSARLGDDVFVAPLLANPEWERLKGNANLLTTCCLTRAVATKRLGTRFFRHYRSGNCPYDKEESWQHLLGKAELARAADQAGYEVTTEARGQTPDGKVWVADVLAELKGRKAVALEMQWSPISRERLRERQMQYEASGVRGIWFRRLGSLESVAQVNESRIPWFRVEYRANQRTFRVPNFDMSLRDFAVATLSTGLRWEARTKQVLHAYLFSNARCWGGTCDRSFHVLLAESSITPDGTACNPSYVDKRGLETAARVLTNQQLLEVGAGPLKERFSHWGGFQMSNGCPACDRIFGEAHRGRLFAVESRSAFRGALRIADDVLENGEWGLR